MIARCPRAVSVGANGTDRLPTATPLPKKMFSNSNVTEVKPSEMTNVSPSRIPLGGICIVNGSGNCMARVAGNCNVADGAVPGRAASKVMHFLR